MNRKSRNISSSKYPLAVYNKNLEMVFLFEPDPKVASKINEKFETIEDIFRNNRKTLTERDMIQTVINSVREIFYYTSNFVIKEDLFFRDLKNHAPRAPKDLYKDKHISLMQVEKFMKHCKGDPQIYAMMTVYLLDRFTKEPKNMRLLHGIAQYMRLTKRLPGGTRDETSNKFSTHYWVTFTSNVCCWHVDAYENILEDFNSPEGKERLEKKYSVDFVAKEAQYVEPTFTEILEIQSSEDKTALSIPPESISDEKKEVRYDEKRRRLYVGTTEYRWVDGNGKIDFNYPLFICSETKGKAFFIFDPKEIDSLRTAFHELKETLKDILIKKISRSLEERVKREKIIIEQVIHKVKGIFSISEKWILDGIDVQHQLEYEVEKLRWGLSPEVTAIVNFKTMMKWKIGSPCIYGIVASYLLYCFMEKKNWSTTPPLTGVVHYLSKEIGESSHWGVIFQSFLSKSFWRVEAMGMQLLGHTAYSKVDAQESHPQGISGLSLEDIVVFEYNSILYNNYLAEKKIENSFYIRASTKVVKGEDGDRMKYKVVFFRDNELRYFYFILNKNGKISVDQKRKKALITFSSESAVTSKCEGKDQGAYTGFSSGSAGEIELTEIPSIQIENFDALIKKYGLMHPITDEIVKKSKTHHKGLF